MSVTFHSNLLAKITRQVSQETLLLFRLWFIFRNSPPLWAILLGISGMALSESALAARTPAPEGRDRPSFSPNLTAQLPGHLEGEAGGNLSQITPLSELSDVQPTDWAFSALQSLVERYACISGYPDRTFRGNRALTRYEFAAGLNACLEQIAAAIGAAETLPPEELEAIARLQEQFAAELSALQSRTDALEVRTAQLEATQFSTTTTFKGEVAIALESAFGDRKADSDRPLDENLTLSQRTRLSFDTSFTGSDRLNVRFEAANMASLAAATGTRFANRNYDGNSDNAVLLNQLLYNFPIGDRVMAQIGTTGDFVEIFDFASTQPYAADALSLINTYNPLIYRVYATNGGPRLGAKIRISDAIGLDTGYFTPGTAATPLPNLGLFNGAYAAAAQLNVELNNAVNLSLSYLHSYQGGNDGYDLSGFTGSNSAADPFFNRANSTNNFGIQGNWRINSRLNVGGFVGYSHAYTQAGESANADIWSWSINLAAPDLGKEGSVFLAAFGMPPKLTGTSGSNVKKPDPDTGYVLDLEYRYPLSNNINLAFGSYAAFNPNHNDENDPIYVVRFRPVFRF